MKNWLLFALPKVGGARAPFPSPSYVLHVSKFIQKFCKLFTFREEADAAAADLTAALVDHLNVGVAQVSFKKKKIRTKK